MIDSTKETLITLQAAAASLPGDEGRPLSYQTVRRWSRLGIKGTRLDTIRIGGRIRTSAQALTRFMERLNSEHQQTSADHAAA